MYKNICDLENLYNSFRRAQLDNHYKRKVCVFAFSLEENINRLHWELSNNRYAPQPYTYFVLHDPKTRNIAAPAFRDRVVQHSLVEEIQPLFEKQFIYDSYACRVDKGTHLAASRLKKFLMASRSIYGKETPIFTLQCDIRKFFKSISWDILLEIIEKTIPCPQTYELIHKIMTTHNHNPRSTTLSTSQSSLFEPQDIMQVSGINTNKRIGLPIGNLTSQLFANIYLNELDHFVKDRLKLRWYGRYMDDFYILHTDKKFLREMSNEINNFLNQKLALSLHPHKLTVKNVKDGVPFVGYLIFYDHILIRGNTLLRMRRNWRDNQKQLENGSLQEEDLLASKAAILGHLKHADSYGLIKSLFE